MVHKILCSLYIFSSFCYIFFLHESRKGIILFVKKAGIYFFASLRLKSCVPQHNFWSQKGNKLMTKFIIHFFALIVFYMYNFLLIPFLVLLFYITDESSVSAVTSSATTFLCSSYYSLGLLLSSFFVLIVNVILMGPLK